MTEAEEHQHTECPIQSDLKKSKFCITVKFHRLIYHYFVNRAEDHLEETLRNIEELSEKVAEQDSTIKSLRKQVTWIGNKLHVG